MAMASETLASDHPSATSSADMSGKKPETTVASTPAQDSSAESTSISNDSDRESGDDANIERIYRFLPS